MKKLIASIILLLIVLKGYSTPLQTDTVLYKITYERLLKATQAFIEIKHRRFQVDELESVVKQKDTVINTLLKSNEVMHELNVQWYSTYQAQNKKYAASVAEIGDLKNENKKLRLQNGFVKIGTPILCVGIGAICFISGYYVSKAVK